MLRGIKTGAAETKQKICHGTMVLSAISAKVNDHPQALLGAILFAHSFNLLQH